MAEATDTPSEETINALRQRYFDEIPRYNLKIHELEHGLLDTRESHEPRIRYAIFTSRGAESDLLCRYMVNLRLGIPLEYFSWRHIDVFSQRFRAGLHGERYREARDQRSDDPRAQQRMVRREREYLKALMSRRSGNGDVFGLTITPTQIDEFRTSFLPTIRRHKFKLIGFKRRDALAAAASFHFSRCTGLWTEDQWKTGRGLTSKSILDPRRIAESLEIVKRHDATIEDWVERKPEVAIGVFTEDLRKDPAGTMKRIQEHLGVEPQKVTPIPAPSGPFEELRQEFVGQIHKILVAKNPKG